MHLMTELKSRSQERRVPSSPSRHHPVSPLARPDGAAAVLQEKASCACGGGCPRCRRPTFFQAKLEVGAPGDQFEQEADRVAEQVTRPEAPRVLQRKCAGGAGAPCARDEAEQEKLRLKPAPDYEPSVASASDDFVRGLGAGQPLDAATRAFMEPRFGRDFGHVRVHTGERAAESAREVNALAYTVGHNIVFGAGRYAPATLPGTRLLAHELTHVLQQGGVKGVRRASLGRPLLQRACGPEEIGAQGGCTGQSGSPVGERFLFRVRCDTLRPGELNRLVAFSRTISNGDLLIIHGFASEEGPAGFNENLSCARARITQAMLAYALGLRGVTASYRLTMHGAMPGRDRPLHRSVVIGWVPAPTRRRETEDRPTLPPNRDSDAGVPTDADAGPTDAGVRPRDVDAGVRPRDIDAGLPPPRRDIDAGQPRDIDASPPRDIDAAEDTEPTHRDVDQGPPPAPVPFDGGTPPPPRPSGPCSTRPNWLSSVQADADRARTMLGRASRLLRDYALGRPTPPNVATMLSRHMYTTSRLDAHSLSGSASNLARLSSSTSYICASDCGGDLAVTIWCIPRTAMRICEPDYFNKSAVERSTTLIHEWLHKYFCAIDNILDNDQGAAHSYSWADMVAENFARLVRDIR